MLHSLEGPRRVVPLGRSESNARGDGKIAPLRWACKHPAVAQPCRDEAKAVVRRLREEGFEAFFAGGCVRDLLLGHEPQDYDVATSAPASRVEKLFARTVAVGIQFGVVKVLGEGTGVEVATFRSDGAYVDHRRPVEVHFSDARGDALRRDFTINGMFLDPFSGEVIDYVGGRADLESGCLRAIGDPEARFAEDRLRLLRAIRFAARFNFEIDPRTWESLAASAPRIVEIAWERIGDEVVKILGAGAARGFALLEHSGLLGAILPEIAAMRGVAQSPEHHPEGDVFVHTLRCLEKLDSSDHDGALALAVLLHDVGKPPTSQCDAQGKIHFYGHCEVGAEMSREICQRLRRSRALTERVVWLVGNHLRHVQAPQMRTAKLKRFLAEEEIDSLLELVRIDALSGSGDLSLWRFCVDKAATLSREELRPVPLLRGRDLLELGFRPGPAFAEILDCALDAQLEGAFTTSEEARAWAQKEFSPEGESDT